MCGILGIYRKSGLTSSDIAKFASMLVRCESRGSHATGVFNARGDFYKAPVASTKFVKLRTVKEMFQESIGLKYIIGHCRFATRGDPKNNDNNHPVHDAKRKFFLVHNGMVECKKFDYNPKNTDTLILMNAIVSHAKNMKKARYSSVVKAAFNDVTKNGDNEMSAIITANGEEIVFARTRSSPLAFQFMNDAIFFASTTDIIGLEPNMKNEKNEDIKEFYNLEDHSMCIIVVKDNTFSSQVLETYPRPVPITKHVKSEWQKRYVFDDEKEFNIRSQIDDGDTINDGGFSNQCADCMYCDGEEIKGDDTSMIYCALHESMMPSDYSEECDNFREVDF